MARKRPKKPEEPQSLAHALGLPRLSELPAEMLEVVKSIHGTPVGKEKENELDHFFVCGQCGQAVDSRSLFQVLHHDESGHRPLGDADLTATATVSEAEQ